MLAAALLAGAGSVHAEEAQAQEERQIHTVDAASVLKYEMTSLGNISEDSRFTFMRDAILVGDGDRYAMLSASGEKIVGGLEDVEYLGGDLYRVREPLEEDNVNKTGLVTGEGEVLIPFEAASIVTPANREKDGIRFLEVIYTTEETDNEDECLIYFTESMFSFSVGEDDVMYKGYARFYDTQKKQFVEGVEVDNTTRNGFYDLGDSFAINHGDTTTMFGPDGSQLWETTGYIEGAAAHALAVSVNGKHYIVDAAGKDAFATDSSLSECSEALDYFKVYDEDAYHIIDMSGKRVTEEKFDTVYGATINNYSVKPASDTEEMKAVAADGSVIAENVYNNINVLGGYSYITFEDSEEITLAAPNGWYAGLQEEYSSNLLFAKDGQPVILNTGETLELPAQAERSCIKPALLRAESTTSSGSACGLYDLFTGEELLPVQYDRIESAGEYILAGTTSSSGSYTWEVYKIAIVPAE